MSAEATKGSSRPLILAVTAAAIVGALWVRADRTHKPEAPAAAAAAAATTASAAAAPAAVVPGGPAKQAAAPKALPTFIELGSDRCKSCKAMVPVLDKLRKEAKGRLKVQFFDVWEDEAAGKRFHVRSIPTQVLLGPDGKELFRHSGYFPYTSVVAKWTELGFDILGKGAPKGRKTGEKAAKPGATEGAKAGH